MNTPATEISFNNVLDILSRRRMLILAPAAIAAVLAVVISRVSPDVYEATAQIVIQEDEAASPLLRDLLGAWEVRNRVALMESVMRSKEVIKGVMIKLGEIDESMSAREVEDKLANFRTQVDVFGTGGGIIQIKVRGPSPEYVHQGATIIVNTFISEMLRPQKQVIDDSTQFLQDQLSRLGGQLRDLENRTASFKTEIAGNLPAFQQMTLDNQQALRQALIDAELALEAALRRKRVLARRLRNANPVSLALKRRLVEARGHLNELKASYTDAHPDVVAAQSLVTELEQRYQESKLNFTPTPLATLQAREPALPGSGTEEENSQSSPDDPTIAAYRTSVSEVAALKGQVDVLKRRVQEAGEDVRAVASNEKMLNRLERELDIKQRTYQELLEKYEDALVTRELSLMDEQNQVWVVENPTPPVRAKRSPLIVVFGGGLGGGLVLGVLLALLAELATSTIHFTERAAKLAGVPVIGVLPRLDA